jgi:HPt (histidine-containing phosphotransfer) domain-containing protein
MLKVVMSLHLERISWMPSPPLAPDDGPIDCGDAGLEREVLAMFAGQSAGIVGALSGLPADAPLLAHTLKGSARAIGAFRVADAAEALEALLRDDADAADATSQALAVLNESIADVRVEIDTILRRS